MKLAMVHSGYLKVWLAGGSCNRSTLAAAMDFMERLARAGSVAACFEAVSWGKVSVGGFVNGIQHTCQTLFHVY